MEKKRALLDYLKVGYLGPSPTVVSFIWFGCCGDRVCLFVFDNVLVLWRVTVRPCPGGSNEEGG